MTSSPATTPVVGAVATSDAAPPDDWVPADRRWAGFDRRTILPALVVLAFMLLMRFGLPSVNAVVPYDDPVVAGDVMAVGAFTFTPAAGWNIEQGVRTDDVPSGGAPPRAVLSRGGVTYRVTVGPFTGDNHALVEQVKTTTEALNGDGGLHVTGRPVPVTADSGIDGMLVRYSGTNTEGVLGGFVADGAGVEIEATGPGDLSADSVRDIASMLASLQVVKRTS